MGFLVFGSLRAHQINPLKLYIENYMHSSCFEKADSSVFSCGSLRHCFLSSFPSVLPLSAREPRYSSPSGHCCPPCCSLVRLLVLLFTPPLLTTTPHLTVVHSIFPVSVVTPGPVLISEDVELGASSVREHGTFVFESGLPHSVRSFLGPHTDRRGHGSIFFS